MKLDQHECSFVWCRRRPRGAVSRRAAKSRASAACDWRNLRRVECCAIMSRHVLTSIAFTVGWLIWPVLCNISSSSNRRAHHLGLLLVHNPNHRGRHANISGWVKAEVQGDVGPTSSGTVCKHVIWTRWSSTANYRYPFAGKVVSDPDSWIYDLPVSPSAFDHNSLVILTFDLWFQNLTCASLSVTAHTL